MVTHYFKRVLEIFQKKGFPEVFRKFKSFVYWRLINNKYRRYYLFKFNTWRNDLQNRMRYDAPPIPYQTIQVNPNQIKYKIGGQRPNHINNGGGLGQIYSGSWDLAENLSEVESHTTIKSISEKFSQGKKWEDTSFHKEWSEKYSEREIHRYSDWETYCSEQIKPYEKLYYDIRDNGYIPNCTVGTIRSSSEPVKNLLEVVVAINRRGEFYFYIGHHRFAISRVLGIEIPVHVICRHKLWQELRDEIHNNGLPEGRTDLRDHPDLQDVLN